ncbi:unnamed protein product [Calypogeia fissa]
MASTMARSSVVLVVMVMLVVVGSESLVSAATRPLAAPAPAPAQTGGAGSLLASIAAPMVLSVLSLLFLKHL